MRDKNRNHKTKRYSFFHFSLDRYTSPLIPTAETEVRTLWKTNESSTTHFTVIHIHTEIFCLMDFSISSFFPSNERPPVRRKQQHPAEEHRRHPRGTSGCARVPSFPADAGAGTAGTWLEGSGCWGWAHAAYRHRTR